MTVTKMTMTMTELEVAQYMDYLLEIGDPEFTKIYTEVRDKHDAEFAAYDTVIDWKKGVTPKQDAILSDRTLSHAEKMVRLTIINRNNRRGFNKRLTRAGKTAAQEMGIKLD